MSQRVSTLVLAAIALACLLGPRLVRLDQPIVENYVGRQIPTAMVARNLDRDGSFLYPKLDTGPFPNYFLVEPPVYAASVVAVRRISGLPLEPAGRLVSALGVLLAAWGLYGLCQPRLGAQAAWGAVLAFAVFPITIRYGRAFQPDALAFGLVLAGVKAWEAAAANGRRWPWLGVVLLATGLAMKVIFVFALVPLLCGTESTGGTPSRRWRFLVPLLLLPALLWYVHAASLIRSGSRASLDNAGIWASVLWPRALGQASTWSLFGRYVLVRSFTPLGVLLAGAGRFGIPTGRFWRVWLVSGLALLLLLAGKAHHEYYWLVLTPPVAAGLTLGIERLVRAARSHGSVHFVLWGAFMALSGVQVADTYKTPAPWSTLQTMARQVREQVPEGASLIAPEAVLYAADRRGCRWETEPAAVRRALGEWGGPPGQAGETPLDLLAWYHARGVDYLADVADPGLGPLSQPWHRAIRALPGVTVLVDQPGLFLVRLSEIPHGARR